MHVCSVYRYSIKYCKVSGKISVLPHTIVKQSRSLKSNLLISPLFSLSKNCMCHEIWDCAEILPINFLLLPKIRFPRSLVESCWSFACFRRLAQEFLAGYIYPRLPLACKFHLKYLVVFSSLSLQSKQKKKSEKDNSTAIRFGWCSFTTAIISVFLFL